MEAIGTDGWELWVGGGLVLVVSGTVHAPIG